MKFGSATRLGATGLATFIGVAAAALPASAAANLVTNGGFDGPTTAYQLTTTSMPGWTSAMSGNVNSYNFVYTPGSADGPGAYTPQFNGYVQLWGPKNAANVDNPSTHPVNTANNSTTESTALPAQDPFGSGGNFIGADGAFEQGAISQTIGGLTVGANYTLTFDWAAGQQYGFYGATTENWSVSFGNSTVVTPTVTTASQGFTPWRQASYTFAATQTSQVLSFLAAGTPNGVPPFSLLDNVSLVAAPEPATWGLMLVGIGGVVMVVRRRSGRRSTAVLA